MRRMTGSVCCLLLIHGNPYYGVRVATSLCDAGRLNVLVAIRDGGEGDVTETHVLWKYDIGMPDICSPLVSGQSLLLIASYGGLICYDRMKGGEPVWEEDFGAMFASSPGLVGEQIYLLSDDGQGWVVTAGADACQRVAENNLGERCVTSPAFLSGRIYLRGEQHLFCIGPP